MRSSAWSPPERSTTRPSRAASRPTSESCAAGARSGSAKRSPERGLERGLIAAAIAEDHPEQLRRALALLERRGETPVDEPSRARALGFLARRGYEPELAYEAVRRLERDAA